MTGTGKTQDVRRWPRFTVTDDAALVLYPQRLLNFVGLGKSNRAKAVMNLSEGGVLVRTESSLAEGTRVRLTLSIEKFGDRIDCAGEVKWCYPAANAPGDFFAGVTFLDLAAADRKKIEKMRSWFSSPECRERTRFRKKSDGFVMPK